MGSPRATASAQDSLSERACSRVKRHDNVGGIASSSPASTSWATNTKRASCAAYPSAIRPTLNSIVGSSGNDAMLSASSSACWSRVVNCSSKRGSASPRAATCCFSIHKAAESSPRTIRNRKVRFPGVPIDSASIASTDAKSCCASAIVVSHTKSSSHCHIVPYYTPQVWLTEEDVDILDVWKQPWHCGARKRLTSSVYPSTVLPRQRSAFHHGKHQHDAQGNGGVY